MTSKVHVIISSQVALGLRLFRDMRLTTLRNTMLHQTNTNTIKETIEILTPEDLLVQNRRKVIHMLYLLAKIFQNMYFIPKAHKVNTTKINNNHDKRALFLRKSFRLSLVWDPYVYLKICQWHPFLLIMQQNIYMKCWEKYLLFVNKILITSKEFSRRGKI